VAVPEEGQLIPEMRGQKVGADENDNGCERARGDLALNTFQECTLKLT
jgi:hypothetical protein